MAYQFNPFTGNFDIISDGGSSPTSPGGSDTQVQFNDGGSFGGATGVKYNKTTNTLTLDGAPLVLNGNISAASWELNGLKIKGGTSTLTDTSGAGTVATGATNVLGGNTIAATNARTITNYYSLYVNDPTAGTNVTLTNRWSLGLAGGLQVGAGNASFTGEATNVALLRAGNANVRTNSTGAMWLEVTGQTAGNARGAGALDWQAVRTSASTVASGANSVAFGARNTASGDYSFANGFVCAATGASSVAIGRYVTAANYCQFGFGGGFPTAGTSQGNLQTFYTATTDASSTPLNITGTATDRMVIPATRSVAFIGIVQAMCNVSSSSNFIKAWKIEGVITRDGNNTTRIVGTPTITELAKDADGTPTPSTWAIASITADDTNEALAINVTGQTGQTIRWQAVLMYSQIGF